MLVILPILSSLFALIISNFSFEKAFVVEKIFRDPLLYGAFFYGLFLNLVRMRLSKKVIHATIMIGFLTILLVFSIANNSHFSTAFKVFRDCIILIIPTFIGYSLLNESMFKRTIVILAVASFVIISIEVVFTPVKFWSKTGYTEYYLKKQEKSIDVNRFENFGGFRDENNVTGLYQNFDSISEKKKMRYRYGGLLGEPIDFGHMFAFFTLFLLTLNKPRKHTNLGRICGLIAIFFGLFFIKTKAFLTVIVIYYLVKMYLEKKLLRVPIIILVTGALLLIVMLSFKYELSTMGHLTNLLFAVQSFIEHPIFGQGLGSTSVLFEDSFVAKMIVEGGCFLMGIFFLFVFYLYKNYKQDDNNSTHKVAFLCATIFPLFLSGAAIHLMSIYLYMFYLGILLRKEKLIVRNEHVSEKTCYSY